MVGKNPYRFSMSSFAIPFSWVSSTKVFLLKHYPRMILKRQEQNIKFEKHVKASYDMLNK